MTMKELTWVAFSAEIPFEDTSMVAQSILEAAVDYTQAELEQYSVMETRKKTLGDYSRFVFPVILSVVSAPWMILVSCSCFQRTRLQRYSQSEPGSPVLRGDPPRDFYRNWRYEMNHTFGPT